MNNNTNNVSNSPLNQRSLSSHNIEKEDQLEKEKEKEGEEEVENNLSSLISFPPLYVAIMEWVLNKRSPNLH